MTTTGGYPLIPISTSQQIMDSAYSRPSFSLNRNLLDTPSSHEQFNDSSPASAAQSLSKSDSPQPELPRLSNDSTAPTSPTQWLSDSVPVIHRRDVAHDIPFQDSTAGLETFDDNILRALCDLDEAAVFLKKRSVIEEEYSKNMQKLARTSLEVYSVNDGKAGTFVNAWQASMRIHEVIAENRFRFAQRLGDISEELNSLSKQVDKNRKEIKDTASRHERALVDAEVTLEKAKQRQDQLAEELERLLVQKEGESYKDTGVQNARSPGGKRAIGKAVAKGGLLLKGKNPANLQRQEDDVRTRVSSASTVMAKAMQDTQQIRQEYFNFQLPRILRNLKNCADEIDNGLQYHLGRYAFLFESLLQNDGSTLAPLDTEALGLRSAVEIIDNRGDFRVYMQNYAVAHATSGQRVPRREGPWQEGFVQLQQQQLLQAHNNNTNEKLPAVPPQGLQSQNSNNTDSPALQIPEKLSPTFGIDLAEQLIRDGVDLPKVMEKCCQTIEKWGLRSKGIYRLSGTYSKIQQLKEKLDRDIDSVDLDDPEWTSDINIVASVLKQWFRELPEPLLTNKLHQGFIEAAKLEVSRARQIRLHERVNDLPDANYATLKITKYEAENQMSISNLAIVFGPTLFGSISGSNGATGMADTTWQNKAIETILEHYMDIFVEEGS
ncbi:hypothetical protein Clacol_005742 [Clathrus columnatus]|uniref:GTPase activating protein n=1 Tax=Clathrus columnatus TaxID=1419009 RepID=A0AAV5AE94_9AGAM|nr:hypothetical protein Clacol_005742 [Clathrus columnatus]